MNLDSTNKTLSNKNEAAKIGQNLLWMVWSASISIANSILLWAYFARMREVEEVGRFTIVMGLYTLFFGICSLGLIPFLVSEISRRSEQNETSSAKDEPNVATFISTASVVLLISGIVCAVLMAVGGFLISASWSVRLSTLILSLAMIPTGLIDVGEATAISFGKTRIIAIATTLENLLRTIIPFVLIWYGFDIWLICVSFVAVRVAALLIYFWAARHKLKFFNFNADDLVKILQVVPTFGGTIIFASINWQAAIILLGLFSTEIESAKYGVASRFLIPVTILMASYASVIQPIITQHSQKSMANAGVYLSKMLSYPLILATLTAIISPFLSRQILTAFFGSRYADVSPTLDILAMSVVPFCIVMIVARGLVATNAQQIDLLANAVGFVVCIVSGLLLIPKYGAIGAATAQLLSFLVMALLETVYLSRKLVSFRIWQQACLSSVFLLLIHLIIWKL